MEPTQPKKSGQVQPIGPSQTKHTLATEARIRHSDAQVALTTITGGSVGGATGRWVGHLRPAALPVAHGTANSRHAGRFASIAHQTNEKQQKKIGRWSSE